MGKTERKERKERERSTCWRMEGCYWRGEFPILMAGTPIPCVAFQLMSFKKLQTVTIMRIEFLDIRPISDGIKVVSKVGWFLLRSICIPTHSRSFLADPEMVANEISVAAQLSGHKNSLKLLGCCLETQIPTLVFEFPMNGNLGDQLRSNPTCLSWKSRLKIANEIASVITYLHTAFPRPIIHRDIHPGLVC